MKDHEIAALVNELTAVARQYHNTQQLRERIAHIVVPAIRKSQHDTAVDFCAKIDTVGESDSIMSTLKSQTQGHRNDDTEN